MRQFLWVLVCCVALLVPVVVLAGNDDGGFDGVVSSIESRYHVRATRIPFLSVITLMSRTAAREGVANLHVAEFEHFSGSVDGAELNRMVEEKLGAGWERMIRETSRAGDEQTLIFTRPEGKRMGLFVLDLDGQELDVVQVSVDPHHLNQNLGRYEHHHEIDHDAGESD
ncbi:MAG TPA: hypothetical protein VMV39_00090 [Terracidiphilus sp.]|nr:hypothetical protein [Terracidiphilus sp.]